MRTHQFFQSFAIVMMEARSIYIHRDWYPFGPFKAHSSSMILPVGHLALLLKKLQKKRSIAKKQRQYPD
jgi:hypothetical protein